MIKNHLHTLQKVAHNFWRAVLPCVTIFSASMVVLAIAAPLLEHLRSPLAGAVYSYLGLSCHQIPSRSFWLFGSNMGICSRCISIYSSFAFTSMLPLRTRTVATRPFLLNNLIGWKLSVLLIALLIVDGGLATFTSYVSTNVLRTATGFLGGTGLACLGYWVHQSISGRVHPC